MSIIIHGRKMPKDGECVVVFPGGVVQKYKAGGIAFYEYQDRTEETEAIELSPHGRLGDLDKMKADYLASTENGKFTVDVPLFIDETETIIPADGGADNG